MSIFCQALNTGNAGDNALGGIFAEYLYTEDNVRGMLSASAESLMAQVGVNISAVAAMLRSKGALAADEFKSLVREELASEAGRCAC